MLSGEQPVLNTGPAACHASLRVRLLCFPPEYEVTMSTFLTIMGITLIVGGIFGLGVWFVRTFDDVREGKL